MMLRVQEIEYTQPGIAKRFKDGRWLEDLTSDLENWSVNPRNHPKMCLEVVWWKGTFYSNNNRRLYCLKQHQANHEASGWQVFVAAQVYDFDDFQGVYNFDDFRGAPIRRFKSRMRDRQNAGTPPGEIQVRGKGAKGSKGRV